jgi:hypothetical protein
MAHEELSRVLDVSRSSRIYHGTITMGKKNGCFDSNEGVYVDDCNPVGKRI